MSMLHVNNNQHRPSEEEINLMWRSNPFRKIEVNQAEAENFIFLLKNSIFLNGRVLLNRFDIAENRVLDWFISRKLLNEINFFEKFLLLPYIQSELSSLLIEDININKNTFTLENPLSLKHDLIDVLLEGGAYGEFLGTKEDANQMVQSFFYDMFENRFKDVLVYKSLFPWSKWFYSNYWYYSWFIIDRVKRSMWLLAITDTDEGA